MKKDTYWWIEDERGLIQFGRKVSTDGIREGGCPELLYSKQEAAKLCIAGEKPVKVKLVRI